MNGVGIGLDFVCSEEVKSQSLSKEYSFLSDTVGGMMWGGVVWVLCVCKWRI